MCNLANTLSHLLFTNKLKQNEKVFSGVNWNYGSCSNGMW